MWDEVTILTYTIDFVAYNKIIVGWSDFFSISKVRSRCWLIGSGSLSAAHLISSLKERWTNRPHRGEPIAQPILKPSCNFLKLLSWHKLSSHSWNKPCELICIEVSSHLALLSLGWNADIGLRKHDVKHCWLMSLPLVIHYLLHLHANKRWNLLPCQPHLPINA